jgi:hypothetical protein
MRLPIRRTILRSRRDTQALGRLASARGSIAPGSDRLIPGPAFRSRGRSALEVSDQGCVVGGALAGAFDVIDPGCVEPVGERLVGCDEVEAHAEVS